MPIRPENLARYPEDWKHISASIRQRAGNRCEWPGCTACHHTVGYWHDGQFVAMPLALREAGFKAGDIVAATDKDGRQLDLKLIRIVLTVAHLDHVPEHVDPANLRAWCQRHHLAYDAEHHKQTAYATRRAGLAVADLFEDATTTGA